MIETFGHTEKIFTNGTRECSKLLYKVVSLSEFSFYYYLYLNNKRINPSNLAGGQAIDNGIPRMYMARTFRSIPNKLVNQYMSEGTLLENSQEISILLSDSQSIYGCEDLINFIPIVLAFYYPQDPNCEYGILMFKENSNFNAFCTLDIKMGKILHNPITFPENTEKSKRMTIKSASRTSKYYAFHLTGFITKANNQSVIHRNTRNSIQAEIDQRSVIPHAFLKENTKLTYKMIPTEPMSFFKDSSTTFFDVDSVHKLIGSIMKFGLNLVEEQDRLIFYRRLNEADDKLMELSKTIAKIPISFFGSSILFSVRDKNYQLNEDDGKVCSIDDYIQFNVKLRNDILSSSISIIAIDFNHWTTKTPEIENKLDYNQGILNIRHSMMTIKSIVKDHYST